MADVDRDEYGTNVRSLDSSEFPPAPRHARLDRDELLQESRELAIAQAALVGPAGSVRPLQKREDLDTSQLAEADEWVSVYSELAQFSRELLAEMVQPGAETGASPDPDASRARLALEIQLKLHELHLTYWRRRRHQLRAGAGRS